jgi:hypothetical protein
MVIETARHLAGPGGRELHRVRPGDAAPGDSTMADQVDVIAGERDMGGTMRLGRLPGEARARLDRRRGVRADRGVRPAPAPVRGEQRLPGPAADAGLLVSGTSPDGRLVEYVELSRELHPFFVGTQAHPEFTLRPTRPQPLFRAFVAAALDYEAAERLPVDIGDVRPARVRPQWTVGRGRPGVTDFDTVSSRTVYTGHVLTLRVDEVRMPGGEVKDREVVEQPGAVGIVALDEQDRVVLIRQYRHPVGEWLIELRPGCSTCRRRRRTRPAARELAEEVALTARRWDVLVDLHKSPGPVHRGGAHLPRPRPRAGARLRPARRDRRGGRPRSAPRPLDEAVAAVFTGEIDNALTVAGLLATAYAREHGWSTLRPAHSPWSARPNH